MRVISETKYYKELAKLYEKCASLSAQLDIYEFDSSKSIIKQNSQNSNDGQQQRTQNNKKQKHTIIKIEQEQIQEKQIQIQKWKQKEKLQKNINTVQQNSTSKIIKKKIKKPKTYNFTTLLSQFQYK